MLEDDLLEDDLLEDNLLENDLTLFGVVFPSSHMTQPPLELFKDMPWVPTHRREHTLLWDNKNVSFVRHPM